MAVKFYEAYKVEARIAKSVRHFQVFTLHNALLKPITGQLAMIEGTFDINNDALCKYELLVTQDQC